MLQDRYGFELSAEHRRNLGESQVDALEGNPLVRQGVADAPDEGSFRTAVLEGDLVQTNFLVNRCTHEIFLTRRASASSTLRRLHTIGRNSAASAPSDFHPGNTAVRWERAATERRRRLPFLDPRARDHHGRRA